MKRLRSACERTARVPPSRRLPNSSFLVPKLHLGMPIGAKLSFAGGGVCGRASRILAPADTPSTSSATAPECTFPSATWEREKAHARRVLDTTATGRVLAVIPRSASQTSPGRGLIEDVQHCLFDVARAADVQSIIVRQFDDLSHKRPHLLRGFRLPFVQLCFERFGDGFHDVRTVFPQPCTVNSARLE